MSGVTKGDLERHNEKLRQTIERLEKMNLDAMALAHRARNDAHDNGSNARHFKQQRDRLIGFLQGYRKDVGEIIEERPQYQPEPPIRISHVDAFLGECREDPEPVNTAARSRP